jgi:hypothetical protein
VVTRSRISRARSGAFLAVATPNVRRMPFIVSRTSDVAVGDSNPAALCATEIDVIRPWIVATAFTPARSVT